MAVILTVGGLQLILLGVLGEYVGRILEQVRGRPLYIVEETTNMEDGQRLVQWPGRSSDTIGAGDKSL